MNLPSSIALVAGILLAVFVVSVTVAGFLFAVSNVFWIGFAALGGASLVASWILGNS